MRGFLSTQGLLALLLSVSLPFALTGCGEEKEKKEQAPPQEAKADVKAEEKIEKKDDAPAKDHEAQKSSAPTNVKNLKIEHDSEEPAMLALSKLDQNAVVARIDGEDITVAQLVETLKMAPDQLKALPLSKVYVPMVKRLRDMRALVKSATKAGVEKLPDIKKKIKEAEEAVVVKHFVDEKINAKITPEFLQQKFDEFMKIYKKDGKTEKEFRLRVILVKDKKVAEDAISRIKKGEKFEELVQTLSTDEKVKETKGDLGYVRFSDLPKDIAEKVQKAATGIVIHEPIQLGGNWAVFKKEDQRNLPDPTLKDVEPELRKVVTPQFFGEVLKDLLKDVKSELIDYKTGTPLDEEAEEAKAKAAFEEAQKEAKKKGEELQKNAQAQGDSAASKE